jgi:hypothetical protein
VISDRNFGPHVSEGSATYLHGNLCLRIGKTWTFFPGTHAKACNVRVLSVPPFSFLAQLPHFLENASLTFIFWGFLNTLIVAHLFFQRRTRNTQSSLHKHQHLDCFSLQAGSTEADRVATPRENTLNSDNGAFKQNQNM